MNQTKDMTNDGYNIAATPNVIELPVAPKASNWGLLSCGVQWAALAGIVMAFSDKNGNGVFTWAAGALMLSLAVAGLGLVWGVFQHVLKTIVRIVRTGN